MKTFTALFGAAALLALLGLASPGQDEPRQEEGVEILARGPIHEAFAQPVLRRQGSTPAVAKKPPQPVEELPPDQRPEGDNVVWIPGYWAWDEGRTEHLWVSGVWRVSPPEHQWVPGYWMDEDNSWYWVSGYWTASESSSIELLPAPPDPIAEAIPVAPDAQSTYVPGVWVYRETRYLWRPGYFVGYRPGWTWCNAGYFWTPGGYVFCDGHWDYDLHHRGICFAPVYFDHRVAFRPGWSYRPRHVVRADFLLGSLFVHVGRNHYFFGDYYEPAYVRGGYQPWVDFRFGGGFHDPLYSYYRWNHRDDPRWESDLRAVYVARRDGSESRPPRTLVEQQRFAAKTPGTQMLALTTLNQVQQTTNIKMQAVAPAQVQAAQTTAGQFRARSQERGKQEAKFAAATPKTGAAPARVELSKVGVAGFTATAPTGAKAPPPRPILPKPSTDVKPGVGTKDPGPSKEPLVKPKGSTVKPKEPTVKPKEPTIKPKEPTIKPKEPTFKPKEPTFKPKEPGKPKEPTVFPKEPPPGKKPITQEAPPLPKPAPPKVETPKDPPRAIPKEAPQPKPAPPPPERNPKEKDKEKGKQSKDKDKDKDNPTGVWNEAVKDAMTWFSAAENSRSRHDPCV